MPLVSTQSSKGYGFFSPSLDLGNSDYFLIEEYTGGASTVTFSSISTEYRHLEIQFVVYQQTTGGGNSRIQLNSDTGSNYKSAYFESSGGSIVTGLSESGTGKATSGAGISGATASDSLHPSSGSIFLPFSNKTDRWKYIFWRGGNYSSYVGRFANVWENTNAITSIKFYTDTGSWASDSRIALFGYK